MTRWIGLAETTTTTWVPPSSTTTSTTSSVSTAMFLQDATAGDSFDSALYFFSLVGIASMSYFIAKAAMKQFGTYDRINVVCDQEL